MSHEMRTCASGCCSPATILTASEDRRISLVTGSSGQTGNQLCAAQDGETGTATPVEDILPECIEKKQKHNFYQ